MQMITIDKLTLQSCGLSEDEGRKLARLLAEDLALVTLPAGCAPDMASVSVNVTQTFHFLVIKVDAVSEPHIAGHPFVVFEIIDRSSTK